jgi:hypothetical protein
MKEQPMSDEKTMGQVIQIDEARIRDHLGEMVRGTVEETLNALLDAEADRLCGAGRYVSFCLHLRAFNAPGKALLQRTREHKFVRLRCFPE